MNQNRACDLGTEDINNDSTCDVDDCAGPTGATGAQGATGPQGAQGPAGVDAEDGIYEFALADSESSTTTTAYQNKLTFTTSNLESGDYVLRWYYELKGGGDSHGRVVSIADNVVTEYGFSSIDSSTNDYNAAGGFFPFSSISGVHTFYIQYKSNSRTAYIRNARLSIETPAAPGPAGADGADGATGSGSNVIIKDEGGNVVNTPHDALNFVGDGVTVTDGGSGIATITIGGSVFGSEFTRAEALSETSTSSSSPQQKLRMTTGSLPSGTYRVGWSYSWWIDDTGKAGRYRLQMNDATQLMYHSQRNNEKVAVNHPGSGFAYVTISGVNTFDLDYWSESDKDTYISDARLELWRVS